MVGDAFGRTLTSFALLCGTLAWTGWAYLHTVGDPHRVEAMATEVLRDDGARSQISHAIAEQLVSATGLDATQQPLVEAAVDVTLGDPRIADNVISALGSAHANALGVNDPRPTVINTSALITAVREHLLAVAPGVAAVLPDGAVDDITLPKYHPPGAGTMRTLARPLTTLFAWLGAFLLIAAFAVGDRRRTLRRFGTWAVMSGIGWLVIPKLIVAAARHWATSFDDVIAVAARVSARAIAPAAAALVIVGLVALVVWIVPTWWPAEGTAAVARPDSRAPFGTYAPQQWPTQSPPGSAQYGFTTSTPAAGPTAAAASAWTPVDTFVRSPDNSYVTTMYPDLPEAAGDGDPWKRFFGNEGA